MSSRALRSYHFIKHVRAHRSKILLSNFGSSEACNVDLNDIRLSRNMLCEEMRDIDKDIVVGVACIMLESKIVSTQKL